MSNHHSNTGMLLTVFAALMVLLGLTVEAAQHHLGRWNFPVAALIACAKAVLIVLFFMNVRRSAAITRVVVSVGFVWLLILFSLSLVDYWSRDWLDLTS